MNVLLLLFFLSLVFSVAGIAALGRSLRQGDVDHSERLSLLPLESERAEPRHD